MNRRYLYITLLLSICLIGLHALGYFYPVWFTWGFHFLGFLSPLYFILFILLACILIIYSYKGKFNLFVEWSTVIFSKQPFVFLSGIVIFFIIAALVFQIKVPLLGDSFLIIKILDSAHQGEKMLAGLHREPLSIAYFYFFIQLFNAINIPDMLRAFLIGEMILGIGFIITSYFIVKNIIEDPLIRMLSFIFLITAQYMQLFFGYVEIYSVVLFCLSLFILLMVLTIREKIPFYLFLLSFSILVYAHYLSLMFIVAVIYLCYIEYKINGLKNILIGGGLIAFITLIILITIKFDYARLIPNIPHAHYLSFWDTADGFQAYTLFSKYHLINLINLFIQQVPFALFIIVLLVLLERKSVLSSTINKFFIFCIIPLLGFLLVVKYDLGMPKDWDISAPFFFIINIFAILTLAGSQMQEKVKIYTLLASTTVLLSLSWFQLNSTVEQNIKRIKTIMDPRIMAISGYYQTIFHLSMYYFYNREIDKFINEWQEYVNRYPGDGRGYEKLAKAYWELGEQAYDSIAVTYERWIKIEDQNQKPKMQYSNFCLIAGNSQMNQGDLTKATKYFRRSIDLNPSSSGAYNNLGLIFETQNQIDSAISLFHTALKLDSTYARAAKNLGDIYLRKGNTTLAIEFYQKAIRLDPGYVNALENLAIVYLTIDKKQEAIETYKYAARMGSRTAQQFLLENNYKW
ncbi:MAG: tetratricopeptide repeat protein [Bacteroidota bacterium]|nr:tetratricopeptide repeat protein [Bacteroidota bacterium]